ncbi:auxin-responsive protein SAUR32-like [Andrographis paniculata]|uniref:auxin-responsive protein SAUR32-like n=1 Tax=Andrographis paniculata TaxID=175694 RepID=UPI0021E88C48|nr:auxin-responsive protein SAUR32-like [Andrographis paniculata]
MPHIHFAPHFHHHNHGGCSGERREARGIPKGCLAITVGQGLERRRFVIPVSYLNHPLFTQLLKEAEEEYGFDQKGAINIPCHLEDFIHVRGLIDKEAPPHHHQLPCFKA